MRLLHASSSRSALGLERVDEGDQRSRVGLVGQVERHHAMGELVHALHVVVVLQQPVLGEDRRRERHDEGGERVEPELRGALRDEHRHELLEDRDLGFVARAALDLLDEDLRHHPRDLLARRSG
jgi:hypothetical protein